MREFMTKLKDRLSEKWNDPEHREDRLAVVIVGTTAAVVIVALLLVLWGYLAGGRDGAGEEASGDALQIATYEEKMKEYMARNKGQADLWQEYAARVDLMSDEVEELLATMTQTQQSLTETIEQYQEEDTSIQKELTDFHTQAGTIVLELKETQTQLYDLTDLVQVMNEETIPLIQQQFAQLEGDMKRTQDDIAGLRTRIEALKKEDDKLWESIEDIEKALGNAESVIADTMKEENSKLWESIGDIENTLEDVESGIIDTMEGEDGKLWESIGDIKDTLENMEGIVENMNVETLRYRYDEKDRTLYLDPYRS